MGAAMPPLVSRALNALPWLVGLALAARLTALWARRLPYPYDLEWMEGGMLAHAWRLQAGLPLYPPPSPDFAPFIYPPGYTAVVAAIGSVVGLSPGLGRAIALAGSLAGAAALVHASRSLGAQRALAWAAALVFLGTYPGTGAFMDLVRPDGLTMGLLGWSIALTLDGRRGTAVASGLLLAAAYLVKHNAAAFGPVLLVAHALRGRGPGMSFAAASIGPALALTGWLQWRSEGRFLEYLLAVPASHPSVVERFFPGTALELGAALPVAAAVAALAWAAQGIERGARSPAVWAPIVTGAGALVAAWATAVPGQLAVGVHLVPGGLGAFAMGAGAAWVVGAAFASRRAPPRRVAVGLFGLLATAWALAGIMRAHNGGFLNVHMHLFWVVSLVFAWLLASMRPRWAAAFVTAQLLYAHATLDATSLRPTATDRARGDTWVKALADREGPVLAPFAAWLPTYAGHPPSVHYMALWDLDYPDGPFRDELSTVHQAVRQGHWPTALRANQAFPFGLDAEYRAVPGGPEKPLMPKSGWPAGPTELLEPR
jgi:hypothetical protein